jgi:hypothetical protein
MLVSRWLATRVAPLLAMGTVALGCDSSPSPPGPGGMGGPGTTMIPVQPRSEGVLEAFSDPNTPLVIAHVDLSVSPSKIVWARSLTLAVGADYPSTYTATVASTMWSSCGGASEGSFVGTVTLRAVAGVTPAISAKVMNDARLIVTTAGEADVTLTVTGEVDVITPGGCASAGVHPFELQLAVSAFRPRGTSFTLPSTCADAVVKRMAPGSQIRTPAGSVSGSPPVFRPLPVNAAGTPTVVDNAAPAAQVAIRVEGPPSSSTGAAAGPSSIDTFVFPDVPGPITLTPAVGGPLVIEVVDPRQVDRVDITIQLAGFAGSPLVLMDQANYTADDWHRKRNRIDVIATATSVGADPLCSAPAPSWFKFASRTADVCQTMAVETWDLANSQSIGQEGRFLADGTCSFAFSMPDLFGGAGYFQNLTFTIAGVALLPEALAANP